MPKDYRKQVVDVSVNRGEDVPCIDCKMPTKHSILASVDIKGEDFYGSNSVHYGIHYQIVQCRGCERITFRHASWNSEDYDIGPDGIETNETIVLYPSRSEGRVMIKDYHLLPADVQRIYNETIAAMNNSLPVLAGIGIRALVESVCRDKHTPGGNLFQQIDGLISLGVLTKEGAKILHHTRTLGNEAAHEVKPHSTDQLALALDVCEHLIQGVYILPHHASNTFVAARKKTKKKGK